MPTQLTVDIDLLQKNPWNSNLVSPENEIKLRASVHEFGMFKPIVVRELEHDHARPFQILGGEHRWEAAKEEGMKQVPIFSLGVIDDKLAKKITLADNARYGQDDTIELAKLLEDIGDVQSLSQILPYTDSDFQSIFAATDIALDELNLSDGFDSDEKISEPEKAAEKAAKTHTIMRFKVAIPDAERATELLAKVMKRQSFTSSDELTNAGDALIHQLFNAAPD